MTTIMEQDFFFERRIDASLILNDCPRDSYDEDTYYNKPNEYEALQM